MAKKKKYHLDRQKDSEYDIALHSTQKQASQRTNLVNLSIWLVLHLVLHDKSPDLELRQWSPTPKIQAKEEKKNTNLDFKMFKKKMYLK